MSDYQTEDGQPKYGVRLNPEELAVLREKQAREAEREREAKARRLAERRAKRRAAKRDFAAAEAEYVRRAREREREREAEHEGHFEHESLAGPEGLSDHEAGHGHEGQAAHEVRADHEGRKSSRGEGTRAPGRSAVREGYNVTNDDDEPAGHYRLAPGGAFCLPGCTPSEEATRPLAPVYYRRVHDAGGAHGDPGWFCVVPDGRPWFL